MRRLPLTLAPLLALVGCGPPTPPTFTPGPVGVRPPSSSRAVPPTAAAAPAPAADYRLGQDIPAGPLTVRVELKVEHFPAAEPGGPIMTSRRPATVVRIGLTNPDPARTHQAGPQAGAARLMDDRGHTYGPADPAAVPVGQIAPGQSRAVRHGEPARPDVLAFEPPADGAEVLYLTLDAGRYGGTGPVRVAIPKAEWYPPPKFDLSGLPQVAKSGRPAGGPPTRK